MLWICSDVRTVPEQSVARQTYYRQELQKLRLDVAPSLPNAHAVQESAPLVLRLWLAVVAGTACFESAQAARL